MKHKVDDEIREIKVQIGKAKTNVVLHGVYEPVPVFRGRETRLALQRKLGELKVQWKAQRPEAASKGREERFVQKAKRHLTRDQFMAIWAEIAAEEAQGVCK